MRMRLLLLSLFIASALRAQTTDPNAGRGFQAGKLYDFHGIDSVATFDGGLTLRLPVGQAFTVRPGFTYQFRLTYNSKVWSYESIGPSERRAAPEWDSNTSLGWTFGLGRILITGVDSYAYLSPDGARHDLIANADGYRYTRDSSYIRALVTTSDGTPTGFQLEFSNGLRHSFRGDGLLTEIRDRYENWVKVSYAPNLWTVTDGHGETTQRTHTITFESAPAGTYPVTRENFQTRVRTVELAAFGDGPAKFEFKYTDTAIPNSSCGVMRGEHDPETVSIDRLTLPTGGAIAWTHGEYVLSSEECTLDPTGLALGWMSIRCVGSADCRVVARCTLAKLADGGGTG